MEVHRIPCRRAQEQRCTKMDLMDHDSELNVANLAMIVYLSCRLTISIERSSMDRCLSGPVSLIWSHGYASLLPTCDSRWSCTTQSLPWSLKLWPSACSLASYPMALVRTLSERHLVGILYKFRRPIQWKEEPLAFCSRAFALLGSPRGFHQVSIDRTWSRFGPSSSWRPDGHASCVRVVKPLDNSKRTHHVSD